VNFQILCSLVCVFRAQVNKIISLYSDAEEKQY